MLTRTRTVAVRICVLIRCNANLGSRERGYEVDKNTSCGSVLDTTSDRYCRYMDQTHLKRSKCRMKGCVCTVSGASYVLYRAAYFMRVRSSFHVCIFHNPELNIHAKRCMQPVHSSLRSRNVYTWSCQTLLLVNSGSCWCTFLMVLGKWKVYRSLCKSRISITEMKIQ